MKKIIFYFVLFFANSHSFANGKSNRLDSDSILRERFVVSLLRDYKKTGRWVYFMMYDSCEGKGFLK